MLVPCAISVDSCWDEPIASVGPATVMDGATIMGAVEG